MDDVKTKEQRRIAIAEAFGVTVCTSCCNAIDPECCHCGERISDHGNYSGHSPVPTGCLCGYAKQPQPKWLGVPDYEGVLEKAKEVVEKVMKERDGALAELRRLQEALESHPCACVWLDDQLGNVLTVPSKI